MTVRAWMRAFSSLRGCKMAGPPVFFPWLVCDIFLTTVWICRMADDLTNASERAAAERLAEALGLPAFEKGFVWLAGAGPGDPGLATALTLHAIASADVILYDALVNEALLKLARPGAELIY